MRNESIRLYSSVVIPANAGVHRWSGTESLMIGCVLPLKRIPAVAGMTPIRGVGERLIQAILISVSEINSSPPFLADAYRLRSTAARLQRRLRAERADMAMGLSRYSALASLHRMGPLSAGALAAQERLRPQSLTRILAALEAEGLITRETDPGDGRRSMLRITERGVGLLRANAERQDRWLADAMARELTRTEREMLRLAAELMDRLAGA